MFHKSNPLSLAEQDLGMKKWFPHFERIKNHKMGIWVGRLRPTEYNSTYKVRVTYTISKSPEVYIIEPKNLRLAKGESQLPHIYPEKGNLCLFLPDKNEWTPDKLIAETTMPWTLEWICYYEYWAYTGKWKGGGEHPPVKQQKPKKKKKIKI